MSADSDSWLRWCVRVAGAQVCCFLSASSLCPLLWHLQITWSVNLISDLQVRRVNPVTVCSSIWTRFSVRHWVWSDRVLELCISSYRIWMWSQQSPELLIVGNQVRTLTNPSSATTASLYFLSVSFFVHFVFFSTKFVPTCTCLWRIFSFVNPNSAEVIYSTSWWRCYSSFELTPVCFKAQWIFVMMKLNLVWVFCW